jgi:hypothetical protein
MGGASWLALRDYSARERGSLRVCSTWGTRWSPCDSARVNCATGAAREVLRLSVRKFGNARAFTVRSFNEIVV